LRQGSFYKHRNSASYMLGVLRDILNKDLVVSFALQA
jgi:hypothetical protein